MCLQKGNKARVMQRSAREISWNKTWMWVDQWRIWMLRVLCHQYTGNVSVLKTVGGMSVRNPHANRNNERERIKAVQSILWLSCPMWECGNTPGKMMVTKNLTEKGLPRFVYLISHLLQVLVVLQTGEEWF